MGFLVSGTPMPALLRAPPNGSDGIFGINEAHPFTDRFPAALIRGGGWGDGSGAGVFALSASIGPSIWDNAFGFRCAR